MKRKGFTLIELLVVIAIIGLLSTLSVVSLNSARGRARDAARKSDLNAISTALELFNVESDDGSYPDDGTDCSVENTLADSDDPNHPLCSGYPIITDAGDTVLQAIPEPPTENGYIGFSNGAGGENDPPSYCISTALEDVNIHFKCINGSCFEDSSGECKDHTG